MGVTSTHVELDSQGNGWLIETTYPSHQTVFDNKTRTKRTQMPKEVTNFVCPVCGNQTYSPVREDNGNNGLSGFSTSSVIGPGDPGDITTTSRISHYVCEGCTTIFINPEDFSKNKPAEVIPILATAPKIEV